MKGLFMNVRHVPTVNPPEDPCAVPLAGGQGELLSVTIVADPRDLEDLLDRLAQSQHPIDPQIYHDAEIDGRVATLVEFPAYAAWLTEIRGLLRDEAVTIRKCMTHRAAN
jgi:hypothetical protein